MFSADFSFHRSKGLTEDGLANLGYKETFILRPGMLLNAERQESRIAEKVAEGFVKGILARVTDAAGIDVRQVAQAFVKASELGTAGLTTKGAGSAPTSKGFNKAENQSGSVTVLTNAELLRLTKSS
jgi:oxidoreductase